MNEDTICAPATIPGTGAISVIRVSGGEALNVASSLIRCAPGKDLLSTPGYAARFGRIFSEDGSLLDEVVATVFRAPHSYTGEDSVEISCHASKYIVDSIILLLMEQGVRFAAPGEFTQRAFLNGKMDLAQAEAVADLIASQNANSHRVALNQMKGNFSSELKGMRNKLLNIVSLMELELDFSEEEVEFADRSELDTLLDNVLDHIGRLISSFRLGNAIKNGIPVAIAGATNTGKSTLLNALLGEERAIVSDVHGTTRDTIEETMNVGGLLFRFIDTAGIRSTEETVEKIGIERTFKKMHEAQLILGMIDVTRSPEEIADSVRSILETYDPEGQKLVFILNKTDLLPTLPGNAAVPAIGEIVSLVDGCCRAAGTEDVPHVLMSAREGEGIAELQQLLTELCQEYVAGSDTTLVTNMRHIEALSHARECLSRVKEGLAAQVPTDLVSQDIREAIYHLGSIVGEISTDEVLGNIFRNFCIGK